MSEGKRQVVRKKYDVAKLFEEFVMSLKEFMAEAGLNMSTLSEALGQKPNYVSYYLCEIKKGKRPYMGFMEEVADYFGAGLVYKSGYWYMSRLPEGVS